MKLTEAIDIAEKDRKEHHSFRTDIIGKAQALLIEAGKQRQWEKEAGHLDGAPLLPGETDD